MTVRPIILRDHEVRATLEGRKTQHRVIIKPGRAPSLFDGTWSDNYVLDPGNADWRAMDVRYAVGDLLWCRERVHIDDAVDGAAATYATEMPAGMDLRGLGYGSTSVCPRWASRLTWEVSEVRVQRLQDISEDDAVAEGVGCTEFWREEHPPSICFAVLWNSIHGQDAWAANPWVAALTFTAHHVNVDELLRQRAVPA